MFNLFKPKRENLVYVSVRQEEKFQKIMESAALSLEFMKKGAAFKGAQYLHKQLLKYLVAPKGSDPFMIDAVNSYRRSLRIKRVMVGKGKKAPSRYIVYADNTVKIRNPKRGQSSFANDLESRKLNRGHVVVYFEKVRKEDPAVDILEKYSPWHLDMIPFVPGLTKKEEKKIAKLGVSSRYKSYYRPVTPVEADKVKKENSNSRRRWLSEMKKLGIKPVFFSRKALRSRIQTKMDVSFLALRLEFGSVYTRAVPHWRPALRDLRAKKRWFPKASSMKRVLNSAEGRKVMGIPDIEGMDPAQAAAFKDFAKYF